MDGVFQDNSTVLIAHILRDAKLLDRIVKANDDNQIAIKTVKGARLGNMGHISRITIQIQNLKHEELIKITSEHSAWNNYLNTGYKENQKRDNTNVGQGRSASFLDEEDDNQQETKEEEIKQMEEKIYGNHEEGETIKVKIVEFDIKKILQLNTVHPSTTIAALFAYQNLVEHKTNL